MQTEWKCRECVACTVCARSKSECESYLEYFSYLKTEPIEKESVEKGAAA